MVGSRKLRFAVLLLPILISLALISKAELQFAGAKTWQVPITGYDPRDLLYGHYINFRFDLDKAEKLCTAGTTGTCALCLRGDVNNPQISVIPALPEQDVRAKCDGWVVDGKNKFQIVSGNYFYLDERKAMRVDQALRRFWGDANKKPEKVTLEMMTTTSGNHRFTDIIIDGVRLKELAP